MTVQQEHDMSERVLVGLGHWPCTYCQLKKKNVEEQSLAPRANGIGQLTATLPTPTEI